MSCLLFSNSRFGFVVIHRGEENFLKDKNMSFVFFLLFSGGGDSGSAAESADEGSTPTVFIL